MPEVFPLQSMWVFEDLPKISLKKPHSPMVKSNELVGLELEIEGVESRIPVPYFNVHEDGSLRNYGVEYVSYPVPAWAVRRLVKVLFSSLRTRNDLSFSARTSIHVHLNVRDLTISQIKTLVLLYCVVEGMVYKWIGHDRDKGIYTVPLFPNDVYGKKLHGLLSLEDNKYNSLLSIVRSWDKYAGINLAPMRSLGTIEFRHLYGTDNINIILTWVDFITKLKETAKRVPFQEVYEKVLSINTDSMYDQFINLYVPVKMFDEMNKQKEMEKQVSHIKAHHENKTDLHISPDLFKTSLFAELFSDRLASPEKYTPHAADILIKEPQGVKVNQNPQPPNLRRAENRFVDDLINGEL